MIDERTSGNKVYPIIHTDWKKELERCLLVIVKIHDLFRPTCYRLAA